MPIKSCPLNIDAKSHEVANRGTPMFPCGGYTTVVGSHICQSIPWHWHDEIEVLVVENGTLLLELAGQDFEIHAGEGVFINSGVLQAGKAAQSSNCEIYSLVFHPSLISGAAESAIEQRYVRPLIDCGELPYIHFKSSVAWHKQAVQHIHDAFGFYEGEAFGYELLVREKLSQVWFLIVNHYQSLLNKQSSTSLDSSRLKGMLAFIHQNYRNAITLADISKSAAIGERECLRCFKRTIAQPPMNYLLRYRVSVAADLLTKTGKSITEICQQCGFESPSYFSMMFKRTMELSPKDYRQLNAR